MGPNKEKTGRKVLDGSRFLALYRPVVEDLANLHASGQIHENIRLESVDIRGHLRFCFPLTEDAAKSYDTDQEIFVHLLPPNKKDGSSLHDGSDGAAHISRRSPYIPLEQMIYGETADARSDVYSLCAVLYQLITGTEPPDIRKRIGGETLKKPSELGIEISPSQEAALLKGLEELGKNRYANGGELYQALYGADHKKEKGRAGKANTNRKKNYLRSGWAIQDEVEEIEELRTITFLDHISQTRGKKWDVSEKKDGSVMAWLEETDGAFDLYIGSDGVIVAGEDCTGMFSGCVNLKLIDFGGNFDTSKVTDMSYMFDGCEKLEELDVSGFNTSQVTIMENMFSYCSALTRLDVSGFDTSKVTNMTAMFEDCEKLEELDVSGFDTSQVDIMEDMFYNCSSLKKLDWKAFDMSQVEDCANMLTGTKWEGQERSKKTENINIANETTDREKREKKENFLRSGWTVKNDVKEIEKLRSVTFLDHIPQTKVKKWDVSEKKDGSVLAWLEENDEGYDLYIGSDGVIMASENCSDMFRGCSVLEEIDLSNFDTSRVTNMSDMFFKCSNLIKLDVSGFDTSQVTEMDFMFWNCSSLTKLDVSGFDTAQVINMQNMFSYCTNLEELDVSGFDTSNVVDMMNMFYNCSSLIRLDVSGFDTSRVENMKCMFSMCSALEKLDVSGFNTSRVTDMSFMFAQCANLEDLDVSGFDTSQVTAMEWMFGLCARLKKLDWKTFDMSRVEDCANMLTGTKWKGQERSKKIKKKENFLRSGWIVKNDVKEIEKLRTITFLDYIPQTKVKKWDVSEKMDGSVLAWLEEKDGEYDLYIGSDGVIVAGESCSSMFSYCNALEKVDMSGFDTSRVINMNYMFYNCSSLIKLDLSGFDTSQVTTMYSMFNNCFSLVSLDLSGFDTSKVEKMGRMFYKCSTLEELDVSGFNTSRVIDMSYMFCSCSSLTKLDLSGFDTSKVTRMTSMFDGCSNLIRLDLTGFDTSRVEDMRFMFFCCSALKELDVSSFDTSRVTDMSCMFYNCRSLSKLDVSNFDTSRVEKQHLMFYNCTSQKKVLG